jgi:hypothetical protein
LYIAGGESSSITIKDHLNHNRQKDEIIDSGPKFDGIILSHDILFGKDRVEYGYIEISKDEQKPYDQKYIYDHTKILKGMLMSFMGDKNWKKGIRTSIMCLGEELCFFELGCIFPDISRVGNGGSVRKASC